MADNSTACVNAVQATLTNGSYSTIETYDFRSDEDFYRVSVPGPGLLSGRLVLYGGARYLRPKFQTYVLGSNCAPYPPGIVRLNDTVQEDSFVARISSATQIVVPVSGSGTSRASGERYQLFLSFVPEVSPSEVVPISLRRADFAQGRPYLPPILNRPVRYEISPQETLPSGTWDVVLPVAGTGILLATRQPGSTTRVSFSPLYASTWWLAVGGGHPTSIGFPVDGSLNSDLDLRVSFYSQGDIRPDTRLSLVWIPACGLRANSAVGSIGCPTRELGANLPEIERLPLSYGGRIVAAFEVTEAGEGPIRVMTRASDFDPWIKIRSLFDGRDLGFDQDDGGNEESLWLETLPPGPYAVEIWDQSGYGSGWTTLAVEQSLDFLDDPGEYPDPPGDLARSKCLSGGLPALEPDQLLEAGFESRTDVDAYLVHVPAQVGSLSLWTLGSLAHAELRDPYQPDQPPLVIADDVGYPFGVERPTNGSEQTLCIVLSSPTQKVERYILGYSFRGTENTSSTAQEGQARSATSCHVPSRLLLDPSIRESADCHTAWRSYIGRKEAHSRLVGSLPLLTERLKTAGQPSAEYVLKKALISDALVFYDLFGAGNENLQLLKGAHAIPRLVLNHLELDAGLEAAIAEVTTCLFDAVEAVVSAYALGLPQNIWDIDCLWGLAANAIEEIWAAHQITTAVRELEGELTLGAFLDEYYAVGGMPNLVARYSTSGSDVVRAIADSRGLLNQSLFPPGVDRGPYFVSIYTFAQRVITEDIEPRVAAAKVDAGD